ncbi:zonular occludens toxin domain-containing protein [Marinobacter salsuginis]|uniref:zonular occludens toxin domain-containing protein n=1 Tax=Marinobacter salsuginis TaxID=418719 RepID=UPI00273FFD6B|nr:zonular occludens toxin domain-containing protein [Marinobacter salsuginis]
MSIVAYAGLPRSGKSYGVVENVIIPGLKAGRTIITNIPVEREKLEADYPGGSVVQFDTSEPLKEEYQEYRKDPQTGRSYLYSTYWDIDKHPKGCIWVIDECWRYWKSGMKANQICEREMQFFTEHGHCVGDDGKTTEIVLVTQDLQQIAACIRALIMETYRSVKLTAVGQSKKYRVDVYFGAVTGQKPGKPMRQLYGSYKPEVYQYYKSHTHNSTDFAAGMEEKVDDRGNVLKHPLIRFGIPFALLVGCWGIYKVYAYFQSYGQEPEVAEMSSEPAVNSSQKVVSAPRSRNLEKVSLPARSEYQSQFEIEPGWLPLSDSWRIVGEVNGVYWIWGESGTRKIHSRNCAKFLKTGEPFCVLQGKLVTYYSYKEPERVERRDNREFTEFSPAGETDA